MGQSSPQSAKSACAERSAESGQYEEKYGWCWRLRLRIGQRRRHRRRWGKSEGKSTAHKHNGRGLGQRARRNRGATRECVGQGRLAIGDGDDLYHWSVEAILTLDGRCIFGTPEICVGGGIAGVVAFGSGYSLARSFVLLFLTCIGPARAEWAILHLIRSGGQDRSVCYFMTRPTLVVWCSLCVRALENRSLMGSFLL